MGDLFVPADRSGGPSLPRARPTALRLCGAHVHPFLLGRTVSPVRGGSFTHGLGYGREHFRFFGTRLDPCCINGLGWAYLHSSSGKFFRFHDLDEYRRHPERGWQRLATGGASLAP